MDWYSKEFKEYFGVLDVDSFAAVIECQMNNMVSRRCQIANVVPKNIIPVDFRKLTAPVMLERIARDWPDAKAAFVIVWPGDGSMPQYFSNTADNAVVMLRLNEFIHKWYNGDFGSPVDNSDSET